MFRKRYRFQAMWQKDAPLREERIALLKISGIGVLIWLLAGIVLLLGNSLFPGHAIILLGIGIAGYTIGIVWMSFRMMSIFYRIAKKQKGSGVIVRSRTDKGSSKE